MIQDIIDLQKNAVALLLEKLNYKNEITFRSPTGSGKTYMMADFMNSILSENNNIVFLVSTLSKGDLATQNYNKFNEYKKNGNFDKLEPFLINTETSGEERLFIPLDHNVYLLPRDLNKKGGRLMQGTMDNFLENITKGKTFGGLEKKIYLLKDECHIKTNNLDSYKNNYFEKVINFSATPNLKRGQIPDVEITDEDAVNVKLIKHIEFGDEKDSVADAINKFKNVKNDYINLLGITPCLIIQISNKDKADYELNNIIFPELNNTKNQDLKWMLIVDKEKECDTNDVFKAKKLPVTKWKDHVKESTSTIDIIIFKMVISEGWDIPRACMLYQVRDTQSKQLDEQVMGRVRRNPKLLDFENLNDYSKDLATTAWIWGVIPEENKKIYDIKLFGKHSIIANELKVKTTKLISLSNRKDFSISDFIEQQHWVPISSNIFTLYKELNKKDYKIKNMCYDYADSYRKWWRFTENLDKIAKQNDLFNCNYEESMVLTREDNGKIFETSLPNKSTYLDNGNYMNINDWVWERNDGVDKFSFDSDAERQWANILKDLSSQNNFNSSSRLIKQIYVEKGNPNIEKTNMRNESKIINEQSKYLWGKNYISSSLLKFEYYLNGIHSSFPDFVMKDCFNRVHIFEIKSLNVSYKKTLPIDRVEYENKVNELKKCYKHASKLTQHIFYLPVLKGDTWHITQLLNGEEKNITKEQFLDFVKNNNKV